MQEIIGIKINIDGTESIKTIGEVRDLLKSAQQDVIKFGSQFGDTSLEVMKAKQKVEDLQNQILKSVKPVSLEDLKNTLKSIPQLNFKGSQQAIDELLKNEKLLEKSITVLKDNLSKVDDNEGFTQVSRIIGTLQTKLEEVKSANKTVVQSFDQVASSISNAFKGVVNAEDVKVKINIDGKEAEQTIGEFRQMLDKAKSEVIEYKVKFGVESAELDSAKLKVQQLQDEFKKNVNILNVEDITNVINSIPKLDLGISGDEFSKVLTDAEALKSLIASLKVNLDTAQTDEQFLATSSVVAALDKQLTGLTTTTNEFSTAIDSIDLSGVQLPKIDVNNLENLNTQLAEAQQELESARDQFGQFSNEAIKASEKVIGLKVAVSEVEGQAVKSFEQLKTELSSAEASVASLQEQFIEAGNSVENAAAIVTDLKAKIADAGTTGDASVSLLSEQLLAAENNLTNLNSQFLTTSKELVDAQANVTGLTDELSVLEQAGKKAFDSTPILEQEASVGSLKSQYKQAVVEVQNIIDKYGITSVEAAKAAAKAAEFRDQIGDANSLIAAFNPDAKFNAFSGSIQGVVAGFTAFQGALAVVGVKGEEVQKTLAKVQGALALSQGLQSVFESIDAFKSLGTVLKSTTVFQAAYNFITKGTIKAKQEEKDATKEETKEVDKNTASLKANSKAKVENATVTQANVTEIKGQAQAVTTLSTAQKVAATASKILRAALVSIGIGAITVAIGYLVENWDKLKKAVLNLVPGLSTVADFIGNLVNTVTDFLGITSEVERQTAALIDANTKKIKEQETFLDLNGDKYDEFTQRKIKANIEFLKSQKEFNEQFQKGEIKSQDELNRLVRQAAEKRNREIIKADGDRVKKSKKDTEDANKERLDANKKANENIAKLELDIKNAAIKDTLKLEEEKLKQEAEQRKKEIKESKADKELKSKQIKLIEEKLAGDLKNLYDKTREAELKSLDEFQKQLDQFRFELKPKANLSALDLAEKQINDKYDQLKKQIESSAATTQEARDKKTKELADLQLLRDDELGKARLNVQKQYEEQSNKNELEFLGVRLKNSQAYMDAEIIAITNDYNKRIELAKVNGEDAEQLERIKQEKIDAVRLEYSFRELDLIINSTTQSFEAKKIAIDQEQKLLDEKYQKDVADAQGNYSLLTSLSEQYTKDINDLTEKRITIAEAEKTAKVAIAQQIGSAFGSLSELLGKQTIAGKIAALAEIATTTGVGFIQGLDIAQKGAKATGPAAPFVFPIFYATQIAAVLSAAAKAKNILSSVKGPSPSGSITAPTVRPEAPIQPTTPQQTTTQLNQQSINQIGSAVFGRSYVLESDVSNQQERQRRLNRAARLT